MEVFSEIRREADNVLQTRFAEKSDSVKSAPDELEGMTLLFLKLRRLNKKIQLECKENKTDLIRQEERVSELKLCLNSMKYQAFKLNEDYTALSNTYKKDTLLHSSFFITFPLIDSVIWIPSST